MDTSFEERRVSAGTGQESAAATVTASLIKNEDASRLKRTTSAPDLYSTALVTYDKATDRDGEEAKDDRPSELSSEKYLVKLMYRSFKSMSMDANASQYSYPKSGIARTTLETLSLANTSARSLRTTKDFSKPIGSGVKKNLSSGLPYKSRRSTKSKPSFPISLNKFNRDDSVGHPLPSRSNNSLNANDSRFNSTANISNADRSNITASTIPSAATAAAAVPSPTLKSMLHSNVPSSSRRIPPVKQEPITITNTGNIPTPPLVVSVPVPVKCSPCVSGNKTSSSSIAPKSTIAARRPRYSIAGQMSYSKVWGGAFGPGRKIVPTAASSTSLFSTAVISGSSSAPNLRDMIPNTATPSGKCITI